jgi:prefoldin subunit 5
MSPVTGRIILPMMPDLPRNYVWLGDRNDRPLPSPIIIDLRLEIIDIRNRLSRTRFILQAPSPHFDSSQALNELVPGILKHDEGIVSIAFPWVDYVPPELPYRNIWLGDIDDFPTATGRIWDDGVGHGNLPAYTPLEYKQIWRMDITGTPVLSTGLTDLEGRVTITEEEIITINEELGTLLTLPYQNVFIGNMENVPTPFPRIFVNNLPTMLSDNSDLLDGAYNLYRGSPDPDILGQPEIVKTLHITNMADLTVGHLWLGTDSDDPLNFGPNRPVEIIVLPLANMADLPEGKIWRGDGTDRPVPVDDLTDLEIRVTNNEGSILSMLSNIASILSSIASLFSSIGTILSAIDGILSAIATITGQITLINSVVVDLQAQIDTNVASGLDHLADLQLQIDTNVASGLDALATINIRLDALELSVTTINSTITTIQSAITTINTTITSIQSDITTLFSDITSINASITSILSSISTINTTLTSLQAQINTINTTITSINSSITTINTTLTTIQGDITNITTVLLPAVYTYIDDSITNITNNFIAGGVIDMDDNRIINLPCDPVEDNDAVSFCFLWHTLHDEVNVLWS